MARLLALACAVVLSTGGPARAGFEWTPPPAAETPAPAAPRPVVVVEPVEPAGPVQPAEVITPLPRPPQEPAVAQTAPAPPPQSQVATAAPTPLLTPLPPAQKPRPAAPQPRQAPKPAPEPEQRPAPDPEQRTEKKLVINPFPLGPDPLAPPAPAATPKQRPQGAAPAPAPTTDGARSVEGFGSGVPLALALRQVVPPDYAFSFDPGMHAQMGKPVSWDGAGRPWPVVAGEMLAPLGLSVHIRGRVAVIGPTGS
jgi:hypothetical protein